MSTHWNVIAPRKGFACCLKANSNKDAQDSGIKHAMQHMRLQVLHSSVGVCMQAHAHTQMCSPGVRRCGAVEALYCQDLQALYRQTQQDVPVLLAAAADALQQAWHLHTCHMHD